MKRTLNTIFCFVFLLFFTSQVYSRRPVDYVNPLIDSHKSRWFYFQSACRPLGMVSLSPDTWVIGTWNSGYLYDSTEVRCFSHIHDWQLAGIPVMSVNGAMNGHLGFEENKSSFSHTTEVAKAGYHKLILDRYGITAELTSTNRVGFHRYTYPDSVNTGHLLFDIGANLAHGPMEKACFKVISDREISGYTVMASTPRRKKPCTVYFHARINASFTGIGGWKKRYPFDKEKILLKGDTLISGVECGGYVKLDVSKQKTILMKVAISYVSEDQARLNMDVELPHWNFDKIVRESADEWNNKLSVIEIEGGKEKEIVKFYTDLWRSLLGRHTFSDVNGKYVDNTGETPVIHQLPLDAEGNPVRDQYNSDAFWGAEWNLNILWSLTYPQILNDFNATLIDYYHNGGLIARGPSGGNYTYVMVGDQAVPMIAAAYNKGIRNFDVEAALKGSIKNAEPGGIRDHAGYEDEANPYMKYYIDLGYVPEGVFPPGNHRESAALTLYFAYEDWCLSQLAKSMDQEDIYLKYQKRSFNYRNLFDESTGWMRPKMLNGEWYPDFSPVVEGFNAKGFVEGNSAIFTYYVPHNIPDLIQLLGGKENFVKKLSGQFEKASSTHWITDHGKHAENWVDYENQPSLHMAHLFSHAGAPWLTQYWVRKIKTEVFGDTTPYGGYNGDEDQGQFGALGVLMAIGLFDVQGGAAADPVYEITTPLFKKVSIKLDNRYYPGKKFEIVSRNSSSENIYIQSVKLNGKDLNDDFRFSHRDFAKGGRLELVLGPQPNKSWGVKKPFTLVNNEESASLSVNEKEAPVVQTAISLLQSDVNFITGKKLDIVRQEDRKNSRTHLIIGTLGISGAVDRLIKDGLINVDSIRNGWEAFMLKTIEWENTPTLVVVGSDSRGTAYGVLELSRKIGVSPWHYFADMPAEKRTELTLPDIDTIQKPSVQYRGIFLNDEDWGFMPWATETCDPYSAKGAIGPKTYEKVFELLLRLKANTLWPAMHECTVPFYLVKGNREMADKYGIIVGTSHCEPMMRCALGEWDKKKRGAYNYPDNRNNVLDFWKERVVELKKSDNIFTIGMRGLHDSMMEGVNTTDEYKEYLDKVIKDQRRLLSENLQEDVTKIPQVFIPYKEVLDVYDSGLNVPEDVTLIWCDDNYGYIRRLSNEEEQKRSGGAGVYYHISYWGRPHDYLWLTSTSPGLIYTEMKRAYDHGAGKMWILNVGDFKVAEYLSEFFLDLAWDIHAVNELTVFDHLFRWNERMFGEELAPGLTEAMKKYYHLAAIRKPEHMGWNRVEEGKYPGLTSVADTEYNPLFHNELENRMNAYHELAVIVRQLKDKLPAEKKDAYFELIEYPVVASAQMNLKWLNAQMARHYSLTDSIASARHAAWSLNAYKEIESLTHQYNKDIAGGKWDKVMSMAPRNLPVFQKPNFTVKDIQQSDVYNDSQRDYFVWSVNADQGKWERGQARILPGVGHSFNSVALEKGACITFTGDLDKSGKGFIKIATSPNHDVNGGGMKCAVYVNGVKVGEIDYSVKGRCEKWKQNVLRNQAVSILDCHFPEAGNVELSIQALSPHIILDQVSIEVGETPSYYEFPQQRKLP